MTFQARSRARTCGCPTPSRVCHERHAVCRLAQPGGSEERGRRHGPAPRGSHGEPVCAPARPRRIGALGDGRSMRRAERWITRVRLTVPSFGVTAALRRGLPPRDAVTRVLACRAGSSTASPRARRSSPTAAWARSSRGAVPRLRCPEEANLRAPESVVAVHVELHRGRRRADRDEHLRRQPPQARRALPRGRARADQLGRRQARPRGARGLRHATSSSPARSARSASSRCSTPRSTRPLFAEQARVLEGRGVDLFMVETFFDLDELVAAIEAVRSVSSLPIVALLTFDEDAETLGGVGAAAAADRLARARRRRDRDEPRRRPARGARRARGDGRRRAAARRAAEHRPREPGRRPRHLPARDARVLRRVRRARAARSAPRMIGGCCGTTPAADRGDPRRGRGGARARARRSRSPSASSPRRAERRRARPALARALREGEWVVSVAARPAARAARYDALLEVARGAQGLRARSASSTSTTTRWRAPRMNALMAVGRDRARRAGSRRSRTSRRATRR